jgi:hypothetical protein
MNILYLPIDKVPVVLLIHASRQSNDMSAGRGHQPSLHDPKATTEAWAARHRPTSDDKFNPHSAFGFHLTFAGALAITLAISIAYAFARALVIGIIIAWAAAWILLDVEYHHEDERDPAVKVDITKWPTMRVRYSRQQLGAYIHFGRDLRGLAEILTHWRA